LKAVACFFPLGHVPEGFKSNGHQINNQEGSVNEFLKSENLGGSLIVVQLLKNEWRKVNEKVQE